MFLSIQHNHMATNAYRNLQKAGFTMGKAMERLSSGYRINTAADGPADLVISEQLRSRIEGLERAIRNTRESGNVLDITDGALGEIQGIIRGMRQLALHSMNTGITSKDQIAANQAELDVALQSIDRIIGTTNYAGRKLLDNINFGGMSGNMVFDGVNVEDLKLVDEGNGILKAYKRNPAASGGSIDAGTLQPLEIPAQLDADGKLTSDKTFTIKGRDGDPESVETLSFTAGTGIDEIVAKLREYTIAPEQADLLDPDFEAPSGRAGTDLNLVAMDLDMLAHVQGLDDASAADFLAGQLNNFTRQFDGQFIQIGEFDLNKLSEGDRKLLELSQNLMNMNSGTLGSVQVKTGVDKNGNDIFRTVSLADMYSGGAASLDQSPDAALKVLEQAAKDISAQRAQIAATRKYAITASENVLMSELESYTRCESFIRDTDMAEATIDLTRSKIVSQVGTQMLSAAMKQSRSILDLLA